MLYTEEQITKHAQRIYQEGNATFTVEKNRCALLVIDMQDEFVKPGWTSSWIPEAIQQVPKIKKVIDFSRINKIPVIYTVFSNTHSYLDRPISGKYMPNRFPELGNDPSWFVDGTIWHELKPNPGEIVIHKPSYGAFYDTPLDTILRGMEKDTLIICGTLTNCCCGLTARQAYERNYYVVFGSDITSTYDEKMQEAEINALRFSFAKIMSYKEIMNI
jgi:nicotinamidase-related amidase